ncbi:hypothetical protein PGTUg99_030634 [Puccinia graminis f. sp. tritici]|uniref:Peptidase A2 domain-containing protein n=1 Tax=Puccinia graminis f. sp. tritici TaxID=56615 RepID=A0A5B0R8G1_PUCGR|nr:hypothetical protein PGTUg99_030634 [Puccinia graminis f. sp. tritici]
MVKKFHYEQSNSRTENTAVQESTSAVIEVEEWGSWLPPQANISEEELQNNIGFGLRKSQRIQDKNPQASSQPMPVKTQESVSKTPPPNQEAIKPPTRRKSFPGSWLEEEELEEEESSKQKPVEPSRERPKQNKEEFRAKETSMEPLDKSIRNKFYKQTYTLTLEEIVKIAPQFLQGLQESQPEYDVSEKKANNVELHCSTGLGTSADEEERGLTYACPVGMVDMTINKRKIRTLVDTGAEMNIIPDTLADQLGLVTTEIFMRLKGIGGHVTPIVGLAENIPVNVLPGYIHLANFFVVRGSVHTVLGRPFLADHNIRLELSHQKGEVLSFPDSAGRRVCIPICLPDSPGWHKEPPALRQNCSFQVVDWDLFDQIDTVGTKDQNITVIEWDHLEGLEETLFYSLAGKSESSSSKEDTSPGRYLNRGQSQDKIGEEDPWKVHLLEAVDWAKELGAATLTPAEQKQTNKQLADAEAAWAAEPIDVGTGREWFWVDYLPYRFKDVFDGAHIPKKKRNTQGWLEELPGGFSDSLDFLQILDSRGGKAFVEEGSWASRFGFISKRLRMSLYFGGGKLWYSIQVARPREKNQRKKAKKVHHYIGNLYLSKLNQ